MAILNPRHKEVWTGKYRGIDYEIVKWTAYDGKPIWNYYIILNEKQVPPERRGNLILAAIHDDAKHPERTSYDYMMNGLWASLPWHGGMTYYSIEVHDGSTFMRAGCDYNHLWDEGQHEHYRIEDVLAEAQVTISALLDTVPDLLIWCSGCGAYFPTSEGSVDEEDYGRCNLCVAKREAEAEKRFPGSTK